MCFHTKLTKKEKELEERFKAVFYDNVLYDVKYHTNGFDNPTQYVILNEQTELIDEASWGLKPEQNFDDNFDKKYNTLNAKSETIFDKKLFKEAILYRRCLILADGFYESKRVNKKSFPFLIQLESSRSFAFAGVYNYTMQGELTCSIITTAANEYMEHIHNTKKRMPFILDPTFEFKWLDNINSEEIDAILKEGFVKEALHAYPVSKDVINSKIDSNHIGIVKEVYYQELDTLF